MDAGGSKLVLTRPKVFTSFSDNQTNGKKHMKPVRDGQKGPKGRVPDPLSTIFMFTTFFYLLYSLYKNFKLSPIYKKNRDYYLLSYFSASKPLPSTELQKVSRRIINLLSVRDGPVLTKTAISS